MAPANGRRARAGLPNFVTPRTGHRERRAAETRHLALLSWHRARRKRLPDNTQPVKPPAKMRTTAATVLEGHRFLPPLLTDSASRLIAVPATLSRRDLRVFIVRSATIRASIMRLWSLHS